MRRFAIVLALCMLAACGSAPAAQESRPSPPSRSEALATIGAGINPPTLPPVPTLTAAERQGVQTARERTKSMVKAARDLQALGQELRATVEWKTKVRTAAQIITGGQKTIALVQLPALVAQRTKDITTNCAKPAESLVAADVDALSIAAVKAQGDVIQKCVTDLEQLQVSLDSL